MFRTAARAVEGAAATRAAYPHGSESLPPNPRFDWKSYEEPTAFDDDWVQRSNPGKSEQE